MNNFIQRNSGKTLIALFMFIACGESLIDWVML